MKISENDKDPIKISLLYFPTKKSSLFRLTNHDVICDTFLPDLFELGTHSSLLDI